MGSNEVFYEEIRPDIRQTDILFDLLKLRIHRISHQLLPNYADHKDFVFSHPYRVWYLVKAYEGYIGSFYITEQNIIGINIAEQSLNAVLPSIIHKVTSEFKPFPAIKSVRAGCFAINVAPSNRELITVLEGRGYRVGQITFNI